MRIWEDKSAQTYIPVTLQFSTRDELILFSEVLQEFLARTCSSNVESRKKEKALVMQIIDLINHL